MDSFVSPQQNPVQTPSAMPAPVPAPFAPTPAQEQPPKKINFRKFITIGSWIFLIIFLPVTVLIFLSQDSVQGEAFYPFKRGLENVVLAAASVNPVTRAAFRTDLADRRFTEAEKLLLASSNTGGLEDFVTGIHTAQTEIATISDPVKKQELQQKIQTSITGYGKKLDAVREQLVAREETAQLALAPTATPALSFPANTPVPGFSSGESSPIPTITPTQAPSITPKQTPTVSPTTTVRPSLVLSPTSAPTLAPTLVPTSFPTSTPVLIPTPTSAPTSGEEAIGVIDEIQKHLRCLQTTAPPHKECVPPEIQSKHSNKETKSGKQNERKQQTIREN